MKKSLVLVDFSNYLHRAYAVNKNLSFAGKNTGGLYGFINMLTNKIDELRPSHVIVCEDSKPYRRIQDYPQYKGDRLKSRDPAKYAEIHQNRQLIKEFLKITGMSFLEVPHWEADDLIASIIREHHDEYQQIFILSNDSDFYQLLEFRNLFLVSKKGLYAVPEFHEDFGDDMCPEDWPWITSLEGSHNGAPGIKGIGTKTALKIVKACADKSDVLDYGDSQYRELLTRNYKLAQLPYPPLADKILQIPRRIPCKEKRLLKFLCKTGITFTKKMQRAFTKDYL